MLLLARETKLKAHIMFLGPIAELCLHHVITNSELTFCTISFARLGCRVVNYLMRFCQQEPSFLNIRVLSMISRVFCKRFEVRLWKLEKLHCSSNVSALFVVPIEMSVNSRDIFWSGTEHELVEIVQSLQKYSFRAMRSSATRGPPLKHDLSWVAWEEISSHSAHRSTLWSNPKPVLGYTMYTASVKSTQRHTCVYNIFYHFTIPEITSFWEHWSFEMRDAVLSALQISR